MTDSLSGRHDLLIQIHRIGRLRKVSICPRPHRQISCLVQPDFGENDDGDPAFHLFQPRTQLKTRLQRQQQFHDDALGLVPADQSSSLTTIGCFKNSPSCAAEIFTDRDCDSWSVNQHNSLDQTLPVIRNMDAGAFGHSGWAGQNVSGELQDCETPELSGALLGSLMQFVKNM